MDLRYLKNINEIQERTFTWLNVNDVTLDNVTLNKNKFSNKYFEDINQDGVVLSYTTPDDLKNVNCKRTGISEDITNENLENFNSGFTLKINDDVQLSSPIEICYKLDASNNFLVNTNIIIAGENSKGIIYVTFLSEEEIDIYNQSYTYILANKNSNLKIVFIQSLTNKATNIQTVVSDVMMNAKLNFISSELGALNTIVRYDIDLYENSFGKINSIYLGTKNRKIDLNYTLNHYGKNSISNCNTTGTLLDYSKKTFKGGIKFYNGSKNSDGSLEENVLLLSKNAKNSSVPLLLCDEDEVRGEHAASIGQLDEGILFYLMTRGFSEKEAKSLFLYSYFNPIIDMIEDKYYQDFIKNKINQEVNFNE